MMSTNADRFRDLVSAIPTRARFWVYTLTGSALFVEGVLDAQGAGVVPERVETIAAALLAPFALIVAAGNTPKEA
jgi:hypothetical protein